MLNGSENVAVKLLEPWRSEANQSPSSDRENKADDDSGLDIVTPAKFESPNKDEGIAPPAMPSISGKSLLD